MTVMQRNREDEALLETIRAVPLPEYVDRLVTELDNDWTGDPSITIFVIVRDEAIQDMDAFSPNAQEIAATLRGAVYTGPSDRLPYIRFRSVSEQAELDVEDARIRRRR